MTCWDTATLAATSVTAVAGVDGVIRDFSGGCALVSGSVNCWGLDPAGPAVPVAGFTSVTGLSGHWSHRCARINDGTARCQGSNQFGELGDGTSIQSSAGVLVFGLSGVAEVAAAGGYQSRGNPHTCARMDDGTARCWGGNNFGQLGDGTTDAHAIPSPVLG